MFKKISAGITDYPEWVTRKGGDNRYRQLDLYDRLLDGTFYDHLQFAFYDEKRQDGGLVKMDQRRPSAQYRLPRMVARWCARKLFAGRHVPKIRHKDAKLANRITTVMRTAGFYKTMNEAVLLGSVGSVGCTFRVDERKEKITFQLWRAKFCKPSFDPMGNLAQLRVSYTTSGAQFIAMDAPGDIEEGENYWYIRDWQPQKEVTYKPVKAADWNPVDGFVGENSNRQLEEWPEQLFEHGLGFVPAHWFTNLPGGTKPDGQCTFEDAIPNSIELDYTLSQVGRGVRYNCSPTPVLIGRMMNTYDRGTIDHIEMEGGYKEADGNTIAPGDAKLLEMSGSGTTAALALIDHLRNLALEQIAASRKDPDKMKAPLSGRAMEYLDEDSNDLVGDLRSQYGEHGALPLLKKVVIAAELADASNVSSLTLQWPRPFQPTPDEILAFIQALVAAVDPLKRAAPATPGKPATATAPATPAVEASAPTEDEQLMTMKEAKILLRQLLDLGMSEMEDEDDVAEQEDVDTSPTPPDEPTPQAPEPTPINSPPVNDQPPNDPNSTVQAADAMTGGMRIGARVTVNA
jgi:hypothetical protein